MKKVFLLLLLSAAFFAANAQRGRVAGSGLSLGIDAGIPVGQYSKPYSVAIGGDLQYETKPAPDLGITFSAGYLYYALKSEYKTPYGPNGASFVPLLVGVKYYFVPTAFFHAQLGAAVGTRKGQGTNFAYTPGLGVILSRNVDLELKYLGISNSAGSINNVGLRLGFKL